MKKKKKKLIRNIILITIIPVLLVLSLNPNRNYLTVEGKIKDLISYITKLTVYPTKSITSREKNAQADSYLIQKNINDSLQKEITELKEILKLNHTLTEYETVNATVITRNNLYWFNSITIDKGENEGIEKDMAVITKDGLIGKISKVSDTTAEVKLLTTDDVTYKISVVIRINDKDNYAILNGYNKENNLLKVSAIDKKTNISEGDIVVTSGLGAMPQGIYIGTVKKMEIDQYNLSKIVYVETNQDFDNIQYVTVLKEKK